jgi:hypothetical protein
MRHLVLLIVLVLSSASPVFAADAPARDSQVDRAVERGLDYLQLTQDKSDGCWRDPFLRPSSAVTGLAIMAFLSSGHIPGEGRYGPTVERGVRWLLRNQQANGLIADNGEQEMYQHGIATLSLAEVAGMTDAELGKDVRKGLQRALAVILKGQRTRGDDRGGWRYRVSGSDSDMSVTGWQVMALRAARNLGCDVPPESIEQAVDYIKRCQDDRTGGFRYRPSGVLTLACTGISVLSLELGGKEQHHSQEALRGGAYLLQSQNLPDPRQEWFFYSVYYGSQATFQLGGNYWAVYRPKLHEALLRTQNFSGYWDGQGRDARAGGRAYCTSMAVLALTVEYRFLPIYQRGEEPQEK